MASLCFFCLFFFFFNDTATTEIYTLSLHDALPILLPFVPESAVWLERKRAGTLRRPRFGEIFTGSRSESTRLNSSHEWISYAVFCLKKKKKKRQRKHHTKDTIRQAKQ